ncbi:MULTISPECIES: hypothetical protein [Roseomonadaceae]|uniref:DUF1833 domain-containing protein n=1 Tax=Falsiroseomonas oleicola TaxID=2801474 RepID=A0ABS6H5M8_9PROT|nr:hypothetical protein [Roseomonas oleicola]MBU8543993.1 hypothetical protein [Roseomonas oleicola]
MAEIPIREAAFVAIEAALVAAALTSLGYPLAVERNRADPVGEGEMPRLVLHDGDQEPEEGDTLEARHACRGLLEGYLVGETTAQVATAINLLHAQVVRALVRPGGAAQPMAIPLGDGIHDIQILEGALRVEVASVTESEAPMASFLLELNFDLRTPWGDPFITIP